MNTNKKLQLGACPECDADIRFSKAPFLGQKKTCPNCYADLIVLSLHPIEMDWEFDYDSYEYENYEDDYQEDY